MALAMAMKGIVREVTAGHENRQNRLAEIRSEVRTLAHETGEVVRSLHASRRAAGIQLRKEQRRELAQRRSDIRKMRMQTRQTLAGMNSRRQEEGNRVRRELAQGAAATGAQVGEMLAQARQSRETFRSLHQQRSAQLKQDLAGMRQDLVREHAACRSQLNDLRRGFKKARAGVRADLNAAATDWRSLAGGQRKSPVQEEGVLVDLEAKLLAAVKERQSGIALAEIAESLGVVPVVLGRAARNLIEKGEVRKEDRLYFPAG